MTLRPSVPPCLRASVPSSPTPTILFAGGGTAGHIFPSLAIIERLRENQVSCRPHLLVSDRPLDAQILHENSVDFTPLPMRPPPARFWALPAWPGFARAWRTSVCLVRKIIEQTHTAVIVAVGGYASAPAIAAGNRARLPVAMLNLDIPPGRANRLMARWATKVFSVCDTPRGAQRIDLPLRRSALGPIDKTVCRLRLGLDPDRHTLLVVGGSQGARSINQMLTHLITMPDVSRALGQWQVLHLVGAHPAAPIRQAYANAQIEAVVRPFCHEMGLAWSGATLAISRAGAGSVAEVRANATPTIFLPYPYHRDLHQKNNARALVQTGAALLYDDLIDPLANARQLATPLTKLIHEHTRLLGMAQAMQGHAPQDGGQVIATWLADQMTAASRP